MKLSSQEEINFLFVEVQDLLRLSRLCPLLRCTTDRRGFTPHTSWFPKRQGSSGPFWISACFARKTFIMLTIKLLLELVQPSNCFTTIDLKVATFMSNTGGALYLQTLLLLHRLLKRGQDS